MVDSTSRKYPITSIFRKKIAMRQSIGSLSVLVIVLAALTLAESSPAAPLRPIYRPPPQARRIHTARLPHTTRFMQPVRQQVRYKGVPVAGLLARRRAGQRAYIVQARQPGWFRSDLMTTEAAVWST